MHTPLFPSTGYETGVLIILRGTKNDLIINRF